MAIFLDLAFVSERWLRHRGLLAKNTGSVEKTLVTLSLVFAIVGTLGLILLAVFDARRHHRLHQVFLGFFL